MVNSTADCARNQEAASGKDVGAPLWEDFIEELIVVVLNVFKELLPALPDVIALDVCTSNLAFPQTVAAAVQ